MSNCHILLAGPAGSGKNLIAHAFANMQEKRLLAYNAVDFASGHEAAAAIFGEKERPGLVELAAHGVLLLDHAHLLPEQVQKRFAELISTARFSRVGEEKKRESNATFVLASDQLPIKFVFNYDLLDLLRVLSVPALKNRKADVPDIFVHLLLKELESVGYTGKPLQKLLTVSHYEWLMLDDFDQTNVDGLAELAVRIAAKIDHSNDLAKAIDTVFAQHFDAAHGAALNPPAPSWSLRDTVDRCNGKATQPKL